MKIGRYFRFVLTICCLGLLYSCGYRAGPEEGLPLRYSTISVPYVEGDIDGSLTAAIIKAICRSGAFEYRTCNGSLILYVEQVDVDEENIGFRYDRKKRGQLTKDIVPTEARITSVVEVTVVEAASNRTVLGPAQLITSIDYDHDFYFSRNGVNIFSLGQLTDLEEAYDAVQPPLHNATAQKIVDYITQSW